MKTGLCTAIVITALAGAHAAAQDGAAEAAVAEGAAEGAAPAEEQAARFHFSMAAEVTNAYFFRGILQEDSGFIVQPYADLALDVFRGENATVSVKAGTWSSFHGEATLADTDDSFRKNWYESDLYAGMGLTTGSWSFDARYIFYTSPSGAFGTIDEFDFSVGFDDSGALGKWALHPAATLAVETGSNAADGGANGTYLQLGVAPGFSFDAGEIKGIGVSFPAVVGLSLSNYYEGTGDENDAFGFASVGAKASVPLNVDESWGAWSIGAGVQVLFLGDAASTFNDDDDVEFVATVGVSAAF